MLSPTSFWNLGRSANKGFISISMLVGSECFYIGESPKFEIFKNLFLVMVNQRDSLIIIIIIILNFEGTLN